MTVPRRLWTGPPAAGIRDRALETLGADPDGLWITPAPLARDQVARALAVGSAERPSSRVLCWDDLWRWVRRESEHGPAWLSATAARALLDEALDRAGGRGLLGPLERFAHLAGYRRQLLERIADWTRAELRPRLARRPARESEVQAAEQSVYALYRRLLWELDAEDEEGAKVWASKRLATSARLWNRLADRGPVVFLGLEYTESARWRVLERAVNGDCEVNVALVYDSDPTASEVYIPTAPARQRLLELGFEEIRIEPPAERPAGLACIERSVFAAPGASDPPIADATGLAIAGAPQGEGAARVVCRAVRQLRERGVATEEILILVRQWCPEAELILEMLRAWGIAAGAEAREPLRCEPAGAALLLAATIPLEDWEAELVVRLLRHGLLRPDWAGGDRSSLAAAASAIRATQVVRGHESLLRGLDRLAASPPEEPGHERRAEQARHARRVVERLVSAVSPLNAARSWSAQVGELRRLARELGLDHPEEERLEPLWDALDDQSDILHRLGRGNEPRSWAATIAEVEAQVHDLPTRHGPAAPGSIRLATVDEAEGARADHVILADLAEGSFPARSAVRPFLALRPGEEPVSAARSAFAREMLRFLGVLGSARREVLFVYPTTDAKGQELLRAGFLDDLLARLAPEAAARCHAAIPRLHPALLDEPDLAGSPGDVRVRALALAGERGQRDALARLAAELSHQHVLRGTAGALFVLQRRLRGTPFSEYEGLLHDGQARLDLDEEFGPDYRFSPSQLETYLSCPFQFFCKYVLKLEVIEERDELGEDLTRRGSQLHDILEEFETLAGQPLDGQSLEELAEIPINGLLNSEPVGATELDLGLWEIERRRLRRALSQYLVQRRSYQRGGVLTFAPARLEFEFGGEDGEFPVLELSQGGRRVLIRGRIDRIDMAQTEDGPQFRVIDYKSGSVPGLGEVRQGVMLQLPLYAMAVQRLIYPDGEAGLFDLGYWSLRSEGFKSMAFSSWDQDQVALVEHVLAVVERLRRGEFVVQSRKDGCENYCEYRGVCRLRQVRRAGKRHDVGLVSLSAQAPRRRAGAGASP
jgi:RecB family exonuclease